jgi:hypothetical protein
MTSAASEMSPDRSTEALRGNFWRAWGLFVLIGLVLYGGLYAWSESLVYTHGGKNRFFMIRTAPPQRYDFVILGASHAMPLGFEDINQRLEEASGAKVINLSTEGSGVSPNRLILDYFLTRHTAGHVIFVLDSFAFYSAEWNEDRLDAALLQYAPFDPALVATLWRYPWARHLLPAYVSGFAKINNENRYVADIPDSELNKFHRTYRPIAQIDRQRVRYLFPPERDPAVFQHYLDEFETLIRTVQDHGMEMMVVKVPTPPRYRDNLPDEAAFDEAVGAVMQRLNVSYDDFSEAVTGNQFFYDTDHLNRDGVMTFVDGYLAKLLRSHLTSASH